jgi:hypothetical protein
MNSSHPLLLPLSALLSSLALAACISPADEPTRKAVAALDRCDVASAHTLFAEAHSLDSNHPHAALGAAITDLITLPEDPQVNVVLERLGFERPLEVQTTLFGADGVFPRLARGDRCQDIVTELKARIPYEPG